MSRGRFRHPRSRLQSFLTRSYRVSEPNVFPYLAHWVDSFAWKASYLASRRRIHLLNICYARLQLSRYFSSVHFYSGKHFRLTPRLWQFVSSGYNCSGRRRWPRCLNLFLLRKSCDWSCQPTLTGWSIRFADAFQFK